MYIGIDLGGTSIRAGVVGSTGKILNQQAVRCNAAGSETEVLEQIFALIEGVLTPEVKGMGIGVPSVVDAEKGIVYNAVNIPSWKEVHLKEILEKRFSLPVEVNNDCNCFSLGVSRFGEAGGVGSVVCVTLGTGVGSTLVLDGKVFNGHNTGAGEIGSIPYLEYDYERYCSSRFFTDAGTTGKEAADAVTRSGSEESLRLWDTFGTHVGNLVKLILFAYDPEMIVFGGSIAKAFPLFSESMWRTVRTFPYPATVDRIRIVPTTMESAGLIGAACLVM